MVLLFEQNLGHFLSEHGWLMQLSEQHSTMIRAVKFDDGSEFHTMDDYSQDLKMTDHEEDEDHWQDDPSVFSGVPLQLWSGADINVKPEEPAQWLDDLADETLSTHQHGCYPA